MAEALFVAYYAVPADGAEPTLDAQRQTIATFIEGRAWTLLGEVVETVGPRRSQRTYRPKLIEALRLCKQKGATLVIATLERLARDVTFLSSLTESGVEFTVVDLPAMSQRHVQVLAAVATQQAQATSARLKAAMQAAKARGVRIGGNTGTLAAVHALGREISAEHRSAKACARARDLMPLIRELQASEGSLRKVAAALTSRGVPTPRGTGPWAAPQVLRILRRAAAEAPAQISPAQVSY